MYDGCTIQLVQMKSERHGQAKVLTPTEIERLFAEGLESARDRALFGVCLYGGCRIAEACQAQTSDVYTSAGRVKPRLILRKAATKGKLATRSIPIATALVPLLEAYAPLAGKNYLFSGRWGRGHLHPDSADKLLRAACQRVDLEGVSTHSFRRTALTRLSAAGVPLRVIQELSGHKTLSALQRYLEVGEEEVERAIAALTF